ncbi:hypothetical protein [Tunturibacter empetritectus]|uniref:Uncharacterized protein n=1 Tax=Tunturiibacter lichenicola TaxID=2051959 RepID=A0A7W8JAL8_9BACT|nr:hypothetical protein [Edaphobacter lichenicola]MBB5345787.1 hypothetical protein [Edaphobacter lichenicola]
MTLPRPAFIASAATIVVLFLCWLFWHSRSRAPAPPPSSSVAASGPVSATDTEDLAPTLVYAHNLLLRKGPNFRIYIRWIRGQMVRTRRQVNPSFDDPDSFVLQIQKGVIHANIGDISNYLNTSSPPNSPLTNISIQPEGEQIKLQGTVHKIVPLPIELIGTLSPTPDGFVKFHLTKLNVLKVPLKGLLGGFHVELSDLVHTSNIPGVQIVDNDIIFDTQKLLPPPHIHGQITTVRVSPPDIEVLYGNAGNDETRLAQWHNFLRLSGGTLDFGKLTMHHVDLTMIDASQDPWFDLDLVNYQAQLVNGYTRMTAQAGLEIFMPDLDEQTPKKAGQSVTLEWLKDRNRSLPVDVPAK